MVFIEKLSPKEKIGLFIAVAFVAFAIADRAIVTPVNDRIQRLNREIKIAEKQLIRHLRNLSQKEIVSKEYAKYIEYVRKVGSDEEEVAKILGEIESLARKSNVYLGDMKPHSPKVKGFHKEYTVEIEAESRMEPLINFLYQINNSPQLLRAEKLRVGSKKEKRGVVKSSILITKLVIP